MTPPLILTAPLSGWTASLDEVPDPVFAGRMLGDGVAIDPTGSSLHAPCEAKVLGVHQAGHAVTLQTTGGAQVLLHLGLETVALKGAGFQPHVREGQTVVAGELLIDFDLDLVAARAKSLITPVVITNGDAFAITRRRGDGRVEVGDFLMEIAAIGPGRAARTEAGSARSRRVIIPLVHGLHARPAALVAAEAKRHRSEVTISAFGRQADARSPVALMTLGLKSQDSAVVSASGEGAEAALDALARLIEHGLPQEAAPARAASLAPSPAAASLSPNRIRGTPAAPGLAIGSAVRLIEPDIPVAENSRGAEAETDALTEAIEAVRARLTGHAASGLRQQRDIVSAHIAFLDDDALVSAAREAIVAGQSAGLAWRGAIRAQVERLRQVDDERIAQRADDLLDLERQVLIQLSEEGEPVQTLPEDAILLAADLAPSQLIGLAGKLAGICTAAGGPTSHVAILAASMNIPAVVAAGPGVMSVRSGATVILDGDGGLLSIAPDAGEIEAAQSRLAASQARRREATLRAGEPCVMADGQRIEVLANIGAQADADQALAHGAEGCGLLRTEFLFLNRHAAPNEDEQALAYQAIADALAGRPLVIRTLDVGGDKPAPYLELPFEDNPALGLRGVRVSLWRPDILRVQLCAILRVTPAGQCKVLVPMIASLSEMNAVRAMVDEVRGERGHEGTVAVGAMIETPAAAMTADLIATAADFLSIGTNDLAQYALAMDRGNPHLAPQVDALHPAVLRLIGAAAGAGRRAGRPVAVCGGLAGDLAAVPILIGLGVTELSAAPALIPEIKALVRRLTRAACEAEAAAALACSSAAEVRALAATAAGMRAP